MMKSIKDESYRGYLEDYETPETLAYEQALDFIYAITEEMEQEGVTKKELAERMGISQSALSQFFDVDGALTLKTIAKFQLALDVRLDFKKIKKTSQLRHNLPSSGSSTTNVITLPNLNSEESVNLMETDIEQNEALAL